jgi:hypothetical protein
VVVVGAGTTAGGVAGVAGIRKEGMGEVGAGGRILEGGGEPPGMCDGKLSFFATSEYLAISRVSILPGWFTENILLMFFRIKLVE